MRPIPRTPALLTLFALLVVLLPVTASAAGPATNEATASAKAAPPASPEEDATAIWSERVDCTLFSPAEVQGYRISCAGGSFFDARISDCCIPGDHWQLKVKAYDANPNTGVTTSPGGVIAYGVPARAYNYGGTAYNAGITLYAECTYLHGVNVFGASSYVAFSSDGVCTVTRDPVRARIDRTP